MNKVNNTSTAGGKGEKLQALKKLGFAVPDFEVIYPNETLEKSEKLNAFFAKNKQHDFAVRSSANVEDGMAQSFAGQFKTLLHVSENQVEEAIELVRGSVHAHNITRYSEAKQIEMVVVVQVMIPAEISGVLFTANPVTGNLNQLVISSVYGLGEGLVSGELNADTFTFKNNLWETKVAQKTTQKEFYGDAVTSRKVETEKSKQPSLSVPQLEELKTISDALKELFKEPQDVEFCYYQNKLWLLQTRPITALPKTNYAIYDNSNIIESYPGITSPLTFSFIIRMYKAVYEQLSGVLGVPKYWIEKNETVYARMLALLNGQVYYNLINWYRVLAMIPGFANNARFMEKMMGTGVSYELPEEDQYSKWQQKNRLFLSVISMLRSYSRLKKETKAFRTYFNGVMSRYKAINFTEKAPWELKQLIQEYEAVLLKKWKAPLINDFFAMIFFGLFEKMLSKWYSGDYPSIHNDLLIGSEDIISAKPVKLLREMDDTIRSNNAFLALFSKAPENVLTELKQTEFKDINVLVENYLEAFGDRSVGELKLETVTYRQEPKLLIIQLQNNLKQAVIKPQFKAQAKEKRTQAERELFSTVKNPLKKWTLRFLLKRTRYLVSNRENLRFERTKVFGMVRHMFLVLGKALYKQGAMLEPRDIFMLKEEELFEWIEGASVTTDLKKLVDLRKAEFQAFEKNPKLNSRIESHNLIYHELRAETEKDTSTEVLKGLACCAGIVEAKVKIVHNPAEVGSLSGEILVTASTDPGWISLFYGASGILVERGSLLSHSAIVSREMGLPCIVAVKGLLNTLKTGDVVRMNGGTGSIEIIEKA